MQSGISTPESKSRVKPLQHLLTNEENARPLGRQQSFMGTGGVEVAPKIVQVEGDLANGMGAVHMGQDAALPRQLADFLDRQDQARGARDVTEREDARSRRYGLAEAFNNFLGA